MNIKFQNLSQKSARYPRPVTCALVISSMLLAACTPTSPVVDRNFGVATKAAKDAQRMPPKYSLNKDAPLDASREHTDALEAHYSASTKQSSNVSTQSLDLEK